MFWTNYHSHSHFCDGKHSLEAQVQEAIAQQMPAFGFSSHVPVPFPSAWNMPLHRLDEYFGQILHLKEQFADQIQLYAGLEVDFIPDTIGPQSDFLKDRLDYSIGSVHYVDAFAEGLHWEIDGTMAVFRKGVEQIFGGDIEQAVRRYFQLTRQMMTDDRPDALGHLDKIKMHAQHDGAFSELAPWYREEVMDTLDVASQTNVMIEVNTRGLYKKVTAEPYPSTWILRELCRRKIPILLNSDSHHPREISLGFSEVAALLRQIGFKEVWVLYNESWQPVSFSEKGLDGPP